MPPYSKKRIPSLKDRKKGSILVLVLVFVVILSFVVVAFLQEATAKIKYYGLFHNQDDLRTDAYSAHEITLAVISQYREIEQELWGPAQGWNDPLSKVDFQPVNATSVQVEILDESGKLSLEKADFDTLRAAFTVFGYDLSVAEVLADSLIDWIDTDNNRRLNGFDGDDYEDKDPPYKPTNGPVRSWDELELIENFKEHFWDEDGRPRIELGYMRQAFSLHNTGPVNINSATPIVVQILEELNLINSYAYEDYKNGSDGILGTEDDRLFRDDSLNQVINEESSSKVSDSLELISIKVTAVRGEARFVLYSLLKYSGANPADNSLRSVDEEQGGREEDLENTEEEEEDASQAERRRRARGDTRTQVSTAAQLGYPFRVIHLSENRSF